MGVAYRIEVDGRDVTAKLRDQQRLLGLRVSDRMGEHADSCALEIDDRPPHVAWPPEGAALQLYAGEGDQLYDLGLFTLDAPSISAPPHRLNVVGHSANFITGSIGSTPLNHMRWRLWENITVSDLANTLAQDHGLTVKVASAVGSIVVGTREQSGEADIAFLARVLGEYDAHVRVKRGRLEIYGKGALLPEKSVSLAEVEGYSGQLVSRRKIAAVTARWLNPKGGQGGEKTAGSGEPRMVLAELYETAAGASSAAKAALKDGERKSRELNLQMTGLRLDLPAGTALTLDESFRSEVAGAWVVQQADHLIDAAKARTTLLLERSV